MCIFSKYCTYEFNSTQPIITQECDLRLAATFFSDTVTQIECNVRHLYTISLATTYVVIVLLKCLLKIKTITQN